MKICRILTAAILAIAIPTSYAQFSSAVPNAGQRNDPLRKLSGLARFVAAGNQVATSVMFDEIVTTSGLPPEVLEEIGQETIKQRVLSAEDRFHKNGDTQIPDYSVVHAVNAIADDLGMPRFAHTSVREVRAIRVWVLLGVPAITTLDSKGNIASSMRPIEAFLVTATLMRQKLLNPAFQLTSEERKLAWAERHGTKTARGIAVNVDPSRSQQMIEALRRKGPGEWANATRHALTVLGIKEVEQ